MIRMFDKKARTISDHVILWIPKFIYLVIAFLSVIFLLRLIIVTNIDASEAEAKILISRVFYSPNIISLQDKESGRAYPGVVDYSKFKQLQSSPNDMDKKTMTYGKDNRLIAAKLVLRNLEKNTDDIVFYNKDNYEFWEPRILSTVEGGSGSVKSFEEQRYVLIKNNNELERGLLKIHVIVRK